MESEIALNFVRDADPEYRLIVERIVETIETSKADPTCAIKWSQLTFDLDVESATIDDFLMQALDKLVYFKTNWKLIQAG